MPNLRGASPVGQDEDGRSYAARSDGREGLAWSARSRLGRSPQLGVDN